MPTGRRPDPLKPAAPTDPLSDFAEAIERIVSRRQLKLQPGDVVIVHAQAGLGDGARITYELHLHEGDALPGRFDSFAQAASIGEGVAVRRGSRLFYLEYEGAPPYLMVDAS